MQHLTFGRRFSCSLLLERIPHRCSVSSGVNFLFAGLSSLKRRYAVEQTALKRTRTQLQSEDATGTQRERIRISVAFMAA